MSTIKEKFNRYCLPNYNPFPIAITNGQESILYDDCGRNYIDFAGGIAVSALGHNHPKLVQALNDAAKGVWHLSNYFTNQAAVDLAEKICKATFADRVFFANSGSEVNEAALKLARKYGNDNCNEKYKIISCNGSFHGRTLFTVSAGGQKKYSEPFAPIPPGIEHIALNDCDALATIDEYCCAFIVEPIQGEGGIISATTEFLQKARQRCNEHNVLLIFDEVQCGMGRTGTLFNYMYHQVIPDIVTSAKALGCGIPIGAMLINEDLIDVLSPGTHGSTFGGNPLACAVANVVFDIINQPKVLSGVIERHAYLLSALKTIDNQLNMFADIRGHGLLIGCELQEQYQHLGATIVRQAIDHGLIMLMALGGKVLRFAPSLIIPYPQIDEGIERLKKTLHDIKREHEK